MKKLYKFYWYCGRMGGLDGLFVAEELEVQKLVGKEIRFGEVLGKHSDVHGIFSESDLEVKTDDQDFISKLVKIVGNDTISGFNPFDYYVE